MTLSTRGARPADRCRRDDGAAIVEFALISVLLVTLVFGIINFGLILSFKQDVTRAAAEGARAGAVAYPAANAFADAEDATIEAVGGAKRDCDDNNDGAIDAPGADTDGMVCNVNLHDCTIPVVDDTPTNPASTGDCVTVELVYDYDDHPLLAKLPMIEPFLPDEIRGRSVARTN
jgi:Flp pilus assembly protein TadG